jgi:hypothetical protein
VARAHGGPSIVRSVAPARGGDTTARPREGGGLEVTVTLPVYREADDPSILQRPTTGTTR